MVSSYEAVATKIKKYLTENNLGELVKEEDEKKYKDFYNLFAPEILEKLEGKEVRDKIFSHDSDKTTLCYTLESSDEYKWFCGGIRGGYAHKFSLFKKRETGEWITGPSHKNRVVGEEESIEIAISIRDAIVEGANYIRKTELNSVDDYIKLSKKLKEIFNNCPANPENSWIHKYYSIIFPDFIPNCHKDDMKKDMIRKLEMEPLRDFFANDGQLYMLSKEANIKLYSLFDERIVGLFYKWDNHMWTDKFDKYHLISKINSTTYWAFTSGVYGRKSQLCFDNSIMAMGWNYLGDLNQYDKNDFEELIIDLIKKEEKLKRKPTSAITSLSAIYKDIKAGDIICFRNGLTNITAIGRVSNVSKYFYNETMDNDEEVENRFYQLRDGIEWTILDEEIPLKGAKFLQNTLYEITDEKILKTIQEIENQIPEQIINENTSTSRNTIYFGAPGTGKSYTLNKDMNDLISSEDNYVRVTFHPDYSYANFVGTYKPIPLDDKMISYEYVPGPFMRTLVKALKNPNENFLLIIEEINRANVAAVFGDIFQLLDRKKDNSSRYTIDTSIDMKKYLEKELGQSSDKIKIPSNMYLWATMNSADQGVYPMDTAFRRRWNFKYFGIDNNEEEIENIKVTINNTEISWNKLRKAINEELLTDEYKLNEDKLIGPFFAFDEYKNTEITEEEFTEIFKNKIIMYLFEDVARSKRNELFSGVQSKGKLTYSKVCDAFDEKGVEIFCDNIKYEFIDTDGE